MNLHADAAEYAWLALRFTYRLSRHESVKLNMGDHEEPLTVAHALLWAERLADEWLS